MSSIVTDTHALIWYIFDLNRLSETALSAFEQAVG
jgi:PIN domain nuclease of toxin-antitoxin system